MPILSAPKPDANVTTPAASDVSFVKKIAVAVNTHAADRLHRHPKKMRMVPTQRAAARSAISRTRRPAATAARSWCATALATSASTAVVRVDARKPQRQQILEG